MTGSRWCGTRDNLKLILFWGFWSAREHIRVLQDLDVLIYAHNAQFEMAICQALLQKTWGIPCPALSRFRCTASMARRAALPASLDMVSTALGLTEGKDKRGKQLIQKFSVMQTRISKKHPHPRRIRPEDDPTEFAAFMEYCAQDVRVEQEVAKRLSYFDDPLNNANYSMDAEINARGVPVNLDALRHAQKLIKEETAIVAAQFRELTGFNFTQGAVILQWCAQQGHPFA